MNPFDPNAFPEGPVGLPVEESVPRGFGDEDLDGELIDFALEFALSADGVIIAGGAIPAPCPEGCPGWAWQAFLEGAILSARGTAALLVAKSANGFEAEGIEEWEEDEHEDVLIDNEGPGEARAPDLPF